MDAYDAAMFLSLALAVGTLIVYVWWGAAHGAFLDPGLVPTALVFTLLGLGGALAAKLEGERARS